MKRKGLFLRLLSIISFFGLFLSLSIVPINCSPIYTTYTVQYGQSGIVWTPNVGLNGNVSVSITVLSISTSSVFFGRDPFYCIWSPTSPANITLAPGETFNGTFTLIHGHDGDISYNIDFYHFYLLLEGGNATFIWSYEVLNTGVYGGSTIAWFGTSMILLIITYIQKRKKMNK